MPIVPVTNLGSLSHTQFPQCVCGLWPTMSHLFPAASILTVILICEDPASPSMCPSIFPMCFVIYTSPYALNLQYCVLQHPSFVKSASLFIHTLISYNFMSLP